MQISYMHRVVFKHRVRSWWRFLVAGRLLWFGWFLVVGCQCVQVSIETPNNLGCFMRCAMMDGFGNPTTGPCRRESRKQPGCDRRFCTLYTERSDYTTLFTPPRDASSLCAWIHPPTPSHDEIRREGATRPGLHGIRASTSPLRMQKKQGRPCFSHASRPARRGKAFFPFRRRRFRSMGPDGSIFGQPSFTHISRLGGY